MSATHSFTTNAASVDLTADLPPVDLTTAALPPPSSFAAVDYVFSSDAEPEEEEDAEGEDDDDVADADEPAEDGLEGEELQEQPSRPRRSRGPRLPDDQKLALVRFAVEHAAEFRKMKAKDWNALLNSFMLDKFAKTMRTCQRVLKNYRADHQVAAARLQRSTGGGIHKSHLEEALDSWDDIVSSHEQDIAAKKAAREATKARLRAAADQAKEYLTTPTPQRSSSGVVEISSSGGRKRSAEEMLSHLDKMQKRMGESVEHQAGLRKLFEDRYRANSVQDGRSDEKVIALEGKVADMEKEAKKMRAENKAMRAENKAMEANSKAMEANMKLLMEERTQRLTASARARSMAPPSSSFHPSVSSQPHHQQFFSQPLASHSQSSASQPLPQQQQQARPRLPGMSYVQEWQPGNNYVYRP